MKIRNKMVLIMTMMTMTAVFGVIAGIVTISSQPCRGGKGGIE